MNPYEFEKMMERLLKYMGLTELETTPKSRDNGIDIRGILVLESIIKIKVAIQVKRYTGSVSAPDIQKLRGSLSNGEVGWFIASSEYTKEARREAESPHKQPISLIGGEKVLELLSKYKLL